MPSLQVIQLRQVLAEKFPGIRLRLDQNRKPAGGGERASGTFSAVADLLQNRLAKGALNEWVAGGQTTGSATLMRALMGWAACQNQIMALVDGADSLDVSAFEPSELAGLLWVRCPDAEASLKAMDLLLRDGNLPFVFLDLKLNPEAQLRKIQAATWYRFQRLLEGTTTICLAITPQPMIPSARARFILKSSFSLSDMERPTAELVEELHREADELRRGAHFHYA